VRLLRREANTFRSSPSLTIRNKTSTKRYAPTRARGLPAVGVFVLKALLARSMLENPRHELFAQALAVGRTSEEAYIEAGFKAHRGNAQRLARDERIRERVRQLLGAAAERAEVSVERVLRELARIAFSDIRKAVRWQDVEIAVEADGQRRLVPAGVRLKSSDEIDDDMAAAIAEVVQTPQGPKIKLHDKRAALIDLGKHLGLFVGKSDAANGLTHVVSGEPLTDAQWEAQHGG